MKALKRIGIYFSIYVLMSVGAIMAVQHSCWWMLPRVSISRYTRHGMSTIQRFLLYARAYTSSRVSILQR